MFEKSCERSSFHPLFLNALAVLFKFPLVWQMSPSSYKARSHAHLSCAVKQKLNFGYIETQRAMETKVIFHFWLAKICSVPSAGDIILLSHTFVTSEITYHNTLSLNTELHAPQKTPYGTKCSCWAAKRHWLPWTRPPSTAHVVLVSNWLQTPVQDICTDLQSPLWKSHKLC